MRITIDIDDELMARAVNINKIGGGTDSKRDIVDAALREWVEDRGILELAGKIDFAPMEEIRPGWVPSDRC